MDAIKEIVENVKMEFQKNFPEINEGLSWLKLSDGKLHEIVGYCTSKKESNYGLGFLDFYKTAAWDHLIAVANSALERKSKNMNFTPKRHVNLRRISL